MIVNGGNNRFGCEICDAGGYGRAVFGDRELDNGFMWFGDSCGVWLQQ